MTSQIPQRQKPSATDQRIGLISHRRNSSLVILGLMLLWGAFVLTELSLSAQAVLPSMLEEPLPADDQILSVKPLKQKKSSKAEKADQNVVMPTPKMAVETALEAKSSKKEAIKQSTLKNQPPANKPAAAFNPFEKPGAQSASITAIAESKPPLEINAVEEHPPEPVVTKKLETQKAKKPSAEAAKPVAPSKEDTATKDLKRKPKQDEEAIAALATETATSQKAYSDVIKQLNPSVQKELTALSKELHLQHQGLAQELQDEEEVSVGDLATLWQAAVERSGTIRFAIEKLSRKDATGKPLGESFTKRLIQSAARLGGVAGSMWTGTPAGVLGGSLVEQIIQGDPSVSAVSRITDADMLILAKEVESLQSDVIERYYQYKHAKAQWHLSQQAKLELGKFYDQLDDDAIENQTALENETLRPLLEAVYDSIRQEEQRYRQEFVSARNALTLLVGAEPVLAIEQAPAETAAK